MKKDAYYFPHFSNARTDRKLLRIRKELGIEGYGIYFMVLEVLREQTDFKFPLEDIDLLSDEFGTSEAKVRTVVCNYKLFDVDKKEMFFSPKQILYLKPYIEKSKRAREAANKRWSANKQIECKSNANALPQQSKSNASKVKNSKVKNSKFKPPTLLEIKTYCEEKKLTVDFNFFFEYFTEGNWIDSKGNKVKNWKQKILTWNKKNGNQQTNLFETPQHKGKAYQDFKLED